MESCADGAEFGRLDKTRTEDWYWDGGEIQVELNAGAYKERPGQELAELCTTDLIRGMANVYRSALRGARDAELRAQTIVSLCVGGMVLARTTNDPELRRSLRAAARDQALALLKGAA